MLATVNFLMIQRQMIFFVHLYVEIILKKPMWICKKTEYTVIETIERAFSRRREWLILKKKKK